MRTHAKEKASPVPSEGVASKPSDIHGGKGNWFRLHWRLLSLFAIVVMAFLLRFVFAYGISAGDNYALSGGTSASSHLRIITEILAGTYDPAKEISMNYPFGTASISGPLFDYVMAAIAWLVTLFGVSDATAAAGTLAWSAPILGALTCIPVFLVAKKLFKDDVIALVSALLYAVSAAMIMTTAFSNGTEYPMLCFLMAWFVYFVASAFDKADEFNATGIKSVFTVSSVRAYTLVAAGFLALIVLTWTGFWAVIAVISAMVLLASIVQRIGGKDLGVQIGISVVILLVSIVIGAIYYIPVGLWEGIYQGGCLLAVLTAVYGLLFLALEKKPWVLSIPVTAIVIVAVAAVLAFVVPDVSHDILSGSVPLTGDLAKALADQFSRTSISTMAAYYGWVTVWLPLFCGLWMAYQFRSHSRSLLYLFTMLWMFACFFVGWFSTEYAVLAGAGFAVGSAYIIVTIVRNVDMKAYLRSLRGNGFKAGAKKALNFFPLVTLLVTVFLVAVPTAVYAVDASTPTNNEHADYFGGLGYTINTSDSSLMYRAWNHYSDISKDGALISWYGYSDAANQIGKFSTVTSSNGGGTSAMASAYLSHGSSGTLASMIIRLIEKNPTDYFELFDKYGVFDTVTLVNDEKAARDYISDHGDDFVQYNTHLSSETVPYLAGVHYLTAQLNDSNLSKLYDELCTLTGNKIGYIEVDSSMIPLYANDGSYASTIAYFGDYSLDSMGSPASLFYVSSTTQTMYRYGYYAQMYYTYADAMYETFLWNALMGVTPSDFGLSSSLDLLSKLANSDGTVKAQPGTGIDNFKIAYWHVMYRATEDGTWTDMDAYEAIAKQNSEGGYINYLSSVIMYEYDNTQVAESGTVTTDTGEPVSGVKVAVYEKIDYDSKSSISYIQRCTVYTDKDGKFTISLPAGDYIVKYYVGSETLRDGVCIETKDKYATDYDITVKPVDQTGTIVDSNNDAFKDSGATISFVGSDGAIKGTAAVDNNGEFIVSDLLPGVYTINVYAKDGSLMNTVSSVTVIDGLTHLTVNVGAAKATVTVNDMYGKEMASGVEVTFVGSNGLTFSKEISGTGDVYLPIGKYSVFVKDANADYVSVQAKTISLDKATSTATATLTVYKAEDRTENPGSIWATLGYSTIADGTTLCIPKSLANLVYEYKGDGKEVSGVLQDNSGKEVAGTVAFIGYETDMTNITAVYVFTAGSDGKFSGHVPDGNYTIYATNSSDACYMSVSAGSTLTDLKVKMEVAYSATASVSYNTNMSPSSVSLAFVPVTFTVKVGDVIYTIPAVTDSTGTYKLYVPKDSTVSYSVALDPMKDQFGDIFNLVEETSGSGLVYKSKDSTAISSNTYLGTFSIALRNDSTTNSVIPIDKPKIKFTVEGDDPKSDFTGKIMLDAFSGSDYDVIIEVQAGKILHVWKKTVDTETEIEYIIPGRYTVTIYEGDDQFIDSQIINLYPDFNLYTDADPKEVTLDVVSGFKVTVTKVNESDTVTPVPIENDDGEKGSYYKKDNDYFFEDGYEYYFKVTDSDGKLTYSEVYSAAGSFKDYTFSESKTLKGYVGAPVNGKLLLMSGSVKVQIDVSNGAYSVDLPKGFVVDGAKLIASVTDDNKEYKYTATIITGSSFTVDEDMTYNFSSTTVKEAESDTVVVDSATMDNGRAEVTITVKNTNSYPVTYYVEGAGALTLDKVYTISIDKGSEDSPVFGTITIKGYYNAKIIGAGNTDVTLEVKSVDGTSIGKVVVDKDYGADVFGDVTITYSGEDGVTDAADGYSYKYALRFTNNNSQFKYVTVNMASIPDGWYAMLVDSSGLLINDLGTSCRLDGLGDTLIYVMLINQAGDSTVKVPSVTVMISGDLTETKELTPQSAEISGSDHSVSGGGADNTAKSVSAGFWILTVVAVLLFLITIWGGMKRGVFSRKN